MRRIAIVVAGWACAGVLPLAAQDSAACKGPGGPMRFLATQYSPWHTGPGGVARMNLVGHSPPYATEVRVYRERYPATYLGDSTKAPVHRNVGTAYIVVLHGTLVVGHGAQADFANVAAYGPRSFLILAASEPYYVWSRGALEVQVTAVGPPHVGPIPRVGGSEGEMGPTFPEARSQTAPSDSTPAAANGLAAWQPTRAGGVMHLVQNTPPAPTELTVNRLYWLPPAMQDSSKLIYHFHYGTELVTILCGTIVYGEGNHVDYSKQHDYGPGSFIENPAGNPHFEWARGPLEAEVDFIGSPGAVPLDPNTGQPK